MSDGRESEKDWCGSNEVPWAVDGRVLSSDCGSSVGCVSDWGESLLWKRSPSDPTVKAVAGLTDRRWGTVHRLMLECPEAVHTRLSSMTIILLIPSDDGLAGSES